MHKERFSLSWPDRQSASRLFLLLALVSPAAGSETLDRDFLLADEDLLEPVAMAEFAPSNVAQDPRHIFSGSLRLADQNSRGNFRIVKDDWDRAGEFGDPVRHLPEFEFEFAQRGSDIVPLQQGVLRREHPYWEIILQPGLVWSEPDDGNWTRASVPFSLQERSANCTHNGVLTWLFNDDDISRVVYQIASETCGYLKFDMWGALDATYERYELGEQAGSRIARLDAHRDSRMPVKPLSALADDYPGTQPLGFGVDDGIHPDDMTVVGMVVDGVNYRSDCMTRFGAYPYCTSLPLPSYSTAKSMFAGIATMRLEKLFPGSSQTPIASLVPGCDAKKWQDVTIENVLDMATGNYWSKNSGEDEDSLPHLEFVFDDEHQSKLDFACDYFPRNTKPGEQFVYHTSDTYLLGVALRALVEHKFAEDADVYRTLLVEPVWRVLNLSPLLDDTKRSYDPAEQPFTGYGLTYEVDDAIRIAAWLSNANGRLDGKSALDEQMLNASLQRSPDDHGLNAGSPDLRYNNSFWAFDAGPTIGCNNPVWVPFMSGVSGITIAMFPNGVIYYYFSDSYIFRWQSGRDAAQTIRDMCQ